jgi:hypothetical protein
MESRPGLVSPQTRQALRTPRAAAIAGIVLSVLLGLSLVIFRIALPSTPTEAESRLSHGASRTAVLFVLNLAPFAGIT